MTNSIDDIDLNALVEMYDELPASSRKEIDKLLQEDIDAAPWRPLIDLSDPECRTPQEQAYYSEADILLYGGAAGGGKTNLLVGLSLTAHRRSVIWRREANQLSPIVDAIISVRKTRKGYNGHLNRFNLGPDREIRLGGMQHEIDKETYQGDARDLMAFDEVTQFLESQFRYVLTWNRSAYPDQRCRVIAATNPPTTSEGDWIIGYWAPWLDKNHPNPALPGELRWFVYDTVEEKDIEVENSAPFLLHGEEVIPRSRTFIPSSVDDNPYLANSGYKAALQALPEPLRSQMLKGDFLAGRDDDAWQIIPSAWVEAAQARWTEQPPVGQKMSALGVDPARGGRDSMVCAPRYGHWFGELIESKGRDVPDGPTGAAICMTHVRHGAPIHLDVIGGAGTSVYDQLHVNGANVTAVDGRQMDHGIDESGKLGFFNSRAANWWRFREALDPMNMSEIMLPPDPQLKADLCVVRWKVAHRGGQTVVQAEGKSGESKDGFGDLKKRLGRSPDKGDAVVMAWKEGNSKNTRLSTGPNRANSKYNVLRRGR